MSNTKIVVLSASGVLGAAASFFAGYFTGKSMERKRLLGEAAAAEQGRQDRDNGHSAHA